ncbi:MAG: hypothetical protein AB7D41_03790 [Arcobacter sp.]|uniref:hypothetical protein n=1 Tax=Arcobacter sp. TaxID=1872629 RepID=UPI003D0105B3
MSLQNNLHHFCKENELEEISCIIQFTIVNYLSSHKSQNEWVYLSPSFLDSFLGIGEDKITELFEYLSTKSDFITKSYSTYCPDDSENDNFCEAINLKDYEEDEEIELHCEQCKKIHTISKIEDIKFTIDYEGNKSKILDELKISSNDIAKEITVLNTSDKHLDMLANILVSRLQIEKEDKVEAKNGLVKILSSVKEVTGLISGIGEDVSKTSKSVKNIIEDFSGISTLKDIIK